MAYCLSLRQCKAKPDIGAGTFGRTTTHQPGLPILMIGLPSSAVPNVLYSLRSGEEGISTPPYDEFHGRADDDAYPAASILYSLSE